jgi:hypothetical protein
MLLLLQRSASVHPPGSQWRQEDNLKQNGHTVTISPPPPLPPTNMQKLSRPTVSHGLRAVRAPQQPAPRRTFASTSLCRAKGDPSTQPAPKSSSQDAPAPKPGDSAMIRQEGPVEGQARHAPDYNVAIDYRTSYGYTTLVCIAEMDIDLV